MSFLKPTPSTSSSMNVNNGLLTSAYSPSMAQGNGATNFLAQLLGVSPSGVSSTADSIGNGMNAIANAGGAQGGYNSYLQNAGFNNVLQRMSQGIVGGAAAHGLLSSGSTDRALLTEGTKLNQGMFDNYLQHLGNLSKLGLEGGGLVANAGQTSKSNGGGPSTVGSIASTIGGIASIFSDRRLKTDIERVGEFEDGLGLYVYRYLGAALRFVGVMADEVARLRPWALGPKVAGFATVNYEAL